VKSKTEYLVYHEGQIQGPFELAFIEAMVMSGTYKPSVIIQMAGTTSQVSFAQVTQSKVVPPLCHTNSTRYSLAPNPGPLKYTPDYLRAAHECRFPEYLSDKPEKPLSIEALIAWIISIPICLWLLWVFGHVAFNQPLERSRITENTSTASTWNNKVSQQSLPQLVKTDIPEPVHTPPAPVPEPGRLPGMKAIYTSPAPVRITQTPTSYNQPQPLKLPAVVLSSSYTPIQQPRLSKPSPSPEESTQIYRDSSGRVYRVSNSDYTRLLRMKLVLDAKNQTIDREQKELSSLSTEIDRSRRYLDRRSQYSVNSFNQKVNSLNAKNNALQGTVDAYNIEVNIFNKELERVGTLIR
jgi:hypothetical protein